MRAPDLIGREFGRLTVVGYVGVDEFRRMIWRCRCSCGNFTNAATQNLTHGQKSCMKCKGKGVKKTHPTITYCGETKPLRVWAAETGTALSTMYTRLRRGWEPEQIIFGKS